jgi:hypothetical protein
MPITEAMKDEILAIEGVTVVGERTEGGRRVIVATVGERTPEVVNRIPDVVTGPEGQQFEVSIDVSSRPTFQGALGRTGAGSFFSYAGIEPDGSIEGEFEGRYRPIRAGVSTGVIHGQGQSTGTIGFFMDDGGTPVALSNSHVYTDVERAPTGSDITQPGPGDGGTITADKIGSLSGHVPFGDQATVDVAWAELDSEVEFEPRIQGLGSYAPQPATVSSGQTVIGAGQTSGVNRATVEIENAKIDGIDLPGSEVGSVVFNDLIATSNWSNPGDSGSPVVLDDGEPYSPVGVHFAASNTLSFAVKIQNVMDESGLGLIGTEEKTGDDGGTEPVQQGGSVLPLVAIAGLGGAALQRYYE